MSFLRGQRGVGGYVSSGPSHKAEWISEARSFFPNTSVIRDRIQCQQYLSTRAGLPILSLHPTFIYINDLILNSGVEQDFSVFFTLLFEVLTCSVPALFSTMF